MPPLLALLALLLSGCCCAVRAQLHALVSAVPGSSVTLRCSYDPRVQDLGEKVWCRQTPSSGCQRVATTSEGPVVGRARIRDDPVLGTVTVTLEALQPQDSGLYHCLVTLPTVVHVARTVQLAVQAGPSWVPVGVGTSTSLQCHYSTEDYRLVPRAWCRLQPRMGCQPLRGAQAFAVPGGARRYRIVEDHLKGVTTLSVEGLQPEDNGVYECRLQLPGAPLVMQRFLLQVRIQDDDERLLLAPSLRTMDANLATAGSPSEKRYHGIRRQMALALGCSLAAAFLLGAIVFGALMLRRSRKKTGDLKPPSGSFRDAAGPPFGVPGESAKIAPCDLKDEDDADLIKYTTLRLSSKPGTPEATYANVRYQSSKQEAPESPSILAISGTVEYATVFFRPSGALIPWARQQQKELAMHTVELPGSSTNALR